MLCPYRKPISEHNNGVIDQGQLGLGNGYKPPMRVDRLDPLGSLSGAKRRHAEVSALQNVCRRDLIDAPSRYFEQYPCGRHQGLFQAPFAAQ